jgi:hypothetical protein
MALLLTLPLMACEPESVMERAGETLDDAGDAITDTIEDARDDTEEFVDEAVE